MSFLRRFFSGISSYSTVTMEAAKTHAQELIKENPVMVFSKSYCPYCKATKKKLEGLGVKYKAYELNEESDGSTMQDALEEGLDKNVVSYTKTQRSVPNTWIGGKHIGGNDDLQALSTEELKKKLADAGAL